MGDVPRAGPARAGSTKDRAEERLGELERRTEELVRAWLVKVIDDLSLREVGRLRLETTVQGFLESYGFVIEASRAELGGKAAAVTEARYTGIGRLARESMVGASETAGAVQAIGRLRELLEQELQGSGLAAPDPPGDPVMNTVVAVCERLTAAVADDAATSRS